MFSSGRPPFRSSPLRTVVLNPTQPAQTFGLATFFSVQLSLTVVSRQQIARIGRSKVTRNAPSAPPSPGRAGTMALDYHCCFAPLRRSGHEERLNKKKRPKRKKKKYRENCCAVWRVASRQSVRAARALGYQPSPARRNGHRRRGVESTWVSGNDPNGMRPGRDE